MGDCDVNDTRAALRRDAGATRLRGGLCAIVGASPSHGQDWGGLVPIRCACGRVRDGHGGRPVHAACSGEGGTEAAEDAEEVVEEVAARGAPAISIVGKTVGGNILVVVPIVGALVVFSVIAYILTQTLYLPPGTFDPSDDRKSQ